VDCNGNSGADVAAAIVEKSKALAHLRPFFQAQRGHKKLPSTLATSHQSCKELARTVLTSDQLYMFRCIRPFTVGQKSMDDQSRPIDLTEIERQVRTIGLLRTAQVMGLAFAVKLSICEFAERLVTFVENRDWAELLDLRSS
jgi:myosin heavy subunit